MTPKIISQTAAEPLTIAECRAHLNITAYDEDSDGNFTHPDDTMIMAMQSAAREACENFMGRAITQKTFEIALDQFPEDDAAIELPLPPLVQVLTVNLGTDSDSLMVENTDYILDDYTAPARIVPVGSWPTVTDSTNQIKIRYVAGYGDGSDDHPLPFAIRAAIMLALGSLYANRENEVIDRGNSVKLAMGVESLLRPFRVRLGMA